METPKEILPPEIRELNERKGDGLTVRLMWYVGTMSTFVTTNVVQAVIERLIPCLK